MSTVPTSRPPPPAGVPTNRPAPLSLSQSSMVVDNSLAPTNSTTVPPMSSRPPPIQQGSPAAGPASTNLSFNRSVSFANYGAGAGGGNASATSNNQSFVGSASPTHHQSQQQQQYNNNYSMSSNPNANNANNNAKSSNNANTNIAASPPHVLDTTAQYQYQPSSAGASVNGSFSGQSNSNNNGKLAGNSSANNNSGHAAAGNSSTAPSPSSNTNGGGCSGAQQAFDFTVYLCGTDTAYVNQRMRALRDLPAEVSRQIALGIAGHLRGFPVTTDAIQSTVTYNGNGFLTVEGSVAVQCDRKATKREAIAIVGGLLTDPSLVITALGVAIGLGSPTSANAANGNASAAVRSPVAQLPNLRLSKAFVNDVMVFPSFLGGTTNSGSAAGGVYANTNTAAAAFGGGNSNRGASPNPPNPAGNAGYYSPAPARGPSSPSAGGVFVVPSAGGRGLMAPTRADIVYGESAYGSSNVYRY